MKICWYIVMLICSIGAIHADWTLGVVINNSDLVIDGAWRLGKTGKPRSITSLAKIFQKSQGAHRSSIVLEYDVSSVGIALHGRHKALHEVDIFVDGQASHSIAWQRKKTKQITEFTTGCDMKDGAYCARVCMKDRANGKLLAPEFCVPYQEDPVRFNLKIDGTLGNYQVTLVKG